jgi:hypothetical protein
VRALHVLLIALAAAAGGAVAGSLLWSRTEPDRTARDNGRALSSALRAGIAATANVRAPYRCARLYTDELEADSAGIAGAAAATAGRTARRRGPLLQVAPPDGDTGSSLILGVVADAHGALDALPAIRRAFAEAGVELVISLGGMGTERDTVARALAALAASDDAPASPGAAGWLVVAIPGDWEPIPAHRAAVAALADRGVIDGSDVRLIEIDGVRLATLPGAPHPSRLMAGREGCVFTTEDAAAITSLLTQGPGVRLLLVHAPPRQDLSGLTLPEPSPTDVGRTAISMGERALADALRTTPVDAVIHGLVASPAVPSSGIRALVLGAPVILPAGVLDPLYAVAEAAPAGTAPAGYRGPTALIADVSKERITWQWISPVSAGSQGAPAPSGSQ